VSSSTLRFACKPAAAVAARTFAEGKAQLVAGDRPAEDRLAAGDRPAEDTPVEDKPERGKLAGQLDYQEGLQRSSSPSLLLLG
jgi:hypothetical protein